MSMMKNQKWSAPHRGMPTEDIGGSSSRLAVTGETVQLYYSNSGVRTTDAGQAAGVMVEGVLAVAPIANTSGDQIGQRLNTSLSFTGTAFTAEVELSYEALESLDNLPFLERLTKVASLVAAVKTAQANGVPTVMANGDYVVDYRKGWIIGKKASTQTSLTSAAYKALSKSAGTSGVTSNSTNFTGMVNTLPRAIYNASPTVRTEGQGGPLQADSLGNLQTNANTLTSGESQARNRMLVVDGGTSTRITTATTTVCRNTTGRLNGVYVEVALTGTATFYDNASAASGTTPWILPIGTVAGWHEFRGATMSNGVVCVTSAADRLVVNTDA